ncbi:MAG: ABC transporter permease [Leptospiraceae bacterium]|nr:ABC transporter permease [Leptospiraceae bacterium]MCP5501790.1 ABC transporter permease [Leptospiraceae bacterium]
MKELDGSGIGLIFQIQQLCKAKEVSVELQELNPDYQKLLSYYPADAFKDSPSPDLKKASRVERIGRKTDEVLDNLKDSIEFLGESFLTFYETLKRPKSIRWREVLFLSERAGVDAFPIIALIGFLMGLITSFQSAIPMQRFGAVIFVANLLGLSLFRELGPLLTAVIMAGRTSSAFAAELGTMKVNEEIDAFTTMGLNPIRFLVIPRLIAAIFVTPFLTIFFNIFGLFGGAIVLYTFDYPFATYIRQVFKMVHYSDFFGGLFKATIFGVLVAGIGCFQGLRTGTGASAVGESTTAAVVQGIIFIAITDGIFSVLFFILGI